MRGLPIELLLLVLFGAFALFNILMQRAARRRRAEAAQQEPLPGSPQERDEDAEEAAPTPATPTPVARPRPQVQRAAPPPQAPRRRFARQTLFATPRHVQDAFVVAAILGRCRADEPHELR